jgi:hypothetical protein
MAVIFAVQHLGGSLTSSFTHSDEQMQKIGL